MDIDSQTKQVTPGGVAKYMLLPGILPRLRRMAGLVAHFLHVFTVTFGAAGLIPRHHPCLLTQNIGKYKFRDIIGLAASNIEFSKRNIPQILMFFAVIGGFLLSILMVGLIVFNLSVSAATAHAQFFDSSAVAAPADDLVYQFLHNVFGSTGLENVWTGNDTAADSRSLMTIALKNMLAFYSEAMMVIAAFIVIYLLIVTVAESAQTGEPFGKKFNTVWAPIRLAVAIGLLVPVSGGYNTAQLIVFQSAHWGSALATNVWATGINTFTSGSMVSAVSPDYGYKFVRGAFLIKMCEAGWNTLSQQAAISDPNQLIRVRSTSSVSSGSEYKIYKWGTRASPDFCGEIKVPIVESGGPTYDGVPIGVFAHAVQQSYKDIATTLVGDDPGEGIMHQTAVNIINALEVDADSEINDVASITNVIQNWIFTTYWDELGYNIPNDRFFQEGQWPGIIAQLDTVAVAAIEEAVGQGWGGAGSFYIRLNELNSITSKAINTRAVVSKMPILFSEEGALPTEPGSKDSLFQQICQALPDSLCTSNREISEKVFNAINRANVWFVKTPIEDQGLASLLKYSTAYEPILADGQQGRTQPDGSDDNFGEISTNSGSSFWGVDANDLNPLAQLASLGNTLMINGGVSWALGVGASYFSPTFGDIMFSLGTILIIAGAALTVVLPFMPFVFFSFAVIEWVISIFEAVVGMPLWALSFLSIGGDDLLGDKAKSGFMMIFEIMLRPTIIIFALVGTILIFSAAVLFFNIGFERFLSDTGAAAIQYSIYTVMYVFAVYSIGNSVFKLIDEMPNQFMRWIGESVQGYGGFTKAGLSDLDTFAAVKAAEKLQPGGFNLNQDLQKLGKKKDDKKKDDRKDDNRKNDWENDANNPANLGKSSNIHQDYQNQLRDNQEQNSSGVFNPNNNGGNNNP